MSAVDDIMKRVSRLSAAERRELARRLKGAATRRTASRAAKPRGKAARPRSVPAKRRGGRRRAPRYASMLALAGKFHSRHRDVSANKNDHLADIYADLHETGDE